MKFDKQLLKTKGIYYWECACNAFLAIIWLRFSYIFAVSFLEAPRLSTVLIGFKNTILAVFYITRRLPKKVTFSFYPWLVAVCGTCAPFLFRPTGTEDFFIAQLMQIVGLLIGLHAHLALNRSFGIVPANRGIMNGGPYQYVRHPIYASYILWQGGYVLNQFSSRNLCVFLAGTILNILRILEEERLLCQDESYQEYASKTRWRMIPSLF
jgi:protein-S-isoprenylcysteine O-methyltransferase Ste14